MNKSSAISDSLSSFSLKKFSHLDLDHISSLSLTPIITQSLSRDAKSTNVDGILALPCLSSSVIVAPDKRNLLKYRDFCFVKGSFLNFSVILFLYTNE